MFVDPAAGTRHYSIEDSAEHTGVTAFASNKGIAVSTSENKLVVRRYLEEVVNTGDVDRIAEFVAPEYVDTHDTSGQSSGIDGARRHVQAVRETYPDLHLTVEQQIAEGEWVVTRFTARGTHLGNWLGIKPTGKRVEITGVNVDRVVGGRIVEHGGAANVLGPLLAIGAVRVVGAEEA
jgi:predicted ester cyclase